MTDEEREGVKDLFLLVVAVINHLDYRPTSWERHEQIQELKRFAEKVGPKVAPLKTGIPKSDAMKIPAGKWIEVRWQRGWDLNGCVGVELETDDFDVLRLKLTKENAKELVTAIELSLKALDEQEN